MERVTKKFEPLAPGFHRFVLLNDRSKFVAHCDVALLSLEGVPEYAVNAKSSVLNVDRLMNIDVAPDELYEMYRAECRRVFVR